MSDLDTVAEAIKASGLLGCGCCSFGDDAYYDKDDCPVEDGYKDHTYYGECRRNEDRSVSVATIAVEALAEKGAEAVLREVRSLADIYATGDHAENVLERIRKVLDR